jgi:putative methyltransferase (TIGR04325 family)
MGNPNGTSTLLRSALARVRSGSPLQAAKELRQFLLFPKTSNALRGRFLSFEEAKRSAPEAAKVGYDTEQHAKLYDERLGKVLISDYAVLFWLSRVASEIDSVFDIGGHKGELFYGFREALPTLGALRWLVHDLPSTTQAGRALAEARGASGLGFTNHLGDGNGCDVVIASGVLQYLERSLSSILQSWDRAPRYVIVNNTPMFEGNDYVTLQNTGISYNPYRVFNRARLIGSLEQTGYVLRDHWLTERSVVVPLRPDLSVDAYQGFFMEKILRG